MHSRSHLHTINIVGHFLPGNVQVLPTRVRVSSGEWEVLSTNLFNLVLFWTTLLETLLTRELLKTVTDGVSAVP